MTVEIKLFGFGDERPPCFGDSNTIRLAIETPATPWLLLRALGITDTTGLVLMNADRVIPERQWSEAIVQDSDRLTLLSAFEGG
ncbi:MAG: MoaD/ThiS family protein [Gammaproteobacteria bacterium]|nr:MoaD/ThiS family protein [Gammaproteobacteria bacterium]MDH3535942.1 MoaD/ThiS family protein [Gammaproteobacteria bacterium]